MPTFEDRIRELLELAKCTQEDAARHAGVTLRTMNGWANGAKMPRTLDAVYQLCDKLGFSGYKTLLTPHGRPTMPPLRLTLRSLPAAVRLWEVGSERRRTQSLRGDD